MQVTFELVVTLVLLAGLATYMLTREAQSRAVSALVVGFTSIALFVLLLIPGVQ